MDTYTAPPSPPCMMQTHENNFAAKVILIVKQMYTNQTKFNILVDPESLRLHRPLPNGKLSHV